MHGKQHLMNCRIKFCPRNDASIQTVSFEARALARPIQRNNGGAVTSDNDERQISGPPRIAHKLWTNFII